MIVHSKREINVEIIEKYIGNLLINMGLKGFVIVYIFIVAMGLATLIIAGGKIKAGISVWFKCRGRVSITSKQPNDMSEMRKEPTNYGWPLYLSPKLYYTVCVIIFFVIVNTAGLPALLIKNSST